MNVKTLCLGILSLREATGYEIKKDVEDGMFSHFIEASYGSIYPALSHLAAEGHVTVREEEQTGRPGKKVYAITQAGRNALERSMSVLPGKDKYKSQFLFQMLLQDVMSPDVVRSAIDKQLADLREDLLCIEQCRANPHSTEGSAFVAGYVEAVLTAAVSYLKQNKAAMGRHFAPRAAE
jgi:PadR family transcriptional regulator, regulatory protein AphA